MLFKGTERKKIICSKTHYFVFLLLTRHNIYVILTAHHKIWRLEVNIQGIMKLSLLDYPGKVACTLFTGGCNLRCPFCHNATLVKNPIAGPDMTNEVLAYLESRRSLLDGVCITGGEPLIQPGLEDFIGKIRDMGYSVKLDTNGSFPDKLSHILEAELVDYVAMDVKSAPETYGAAIGADTDFGVFARSIELIKKSSVPHEFRTTAVKGIHTVSDFESIGKLLGDEPYFIQSFVDSGNLLGSGCSAFSADEMKALLEAVLPFTPRASLRGTDV